MSVGDQHGDPFGVATDRMSPARGRRVGASAEGGVCDLVVANARVVAPRVPADRARATIPAVSGFPRPTPHRPQNGRARIRSDAFSHRIGRNRDQAGKIIVGRSVGHGERGWLIPLGVEWLSHRFLSRVRLAKIDPSHQEGWATESSNRRRVPRRCDRNYVTPIASRSYREVLPTCLTTRRISIRRVRPVGGRFESPSTCLPLG